ncbi:SIR2 family protein [Ekhidna sp.]|uniref:SIR2 family protein n=1 Tax=Ekhidna sp. TaxID=2608089 RepID=UPI003BAB3941
MEQPPKEIQEDQIKKSKDYVKNLAEDLAMNRLIASFNFNTNTLSPSTAKEIVATIKKDFLNKLGGDQKQHSDPEALVKFVEKIKTRNILVVGAGMSKAFYNLPAAKKALDQIKKSLGIYGVTGLSKKLKKSKWEHSKVLNKFLEKYLDEEKNLKHLFPHITDMDQNSELDFELTLSLLASHFGTKAIREEIQKIYDLRYNPAIGYSIIAFLLRHRYIDAVVNFNFDELLDQAINEKIVDDHRFILSDGDCRDISDLMVKDGMNVPLYIKPHGTVSHKSTMRFTKDDYLGIPNDLQLFLNSLIKGEISTSDGDKNLDSIAIKRVNLILMGFDMGSIEFNQIIEDAIYERAIKSDKEICFYLFEFAKMNKKGKEDEVEAENKFLSDKNLQRKIRRVIKDALKRHELDDKIELSEKDIKEKVAVKLIRVDSRGELSLERHLRSINTHIHGLDDPQKKLSKEEEGLYEPRYSPRGIYADEIIDHLFHEDYSKAFFDQDEQKKKSRLKGYFLNRTKVEILIALAIDKGTINLFQLIHGNAGLYFNEFLKCLTIKERKADAITSITQLVNKMGIKRNEKYARELFSDAKITGIFSRIPQNELINRIDKASDHLMKKLKVFMPGLKNEKKIKRCFAQLCKKNTYTISPEYHSRRFLFIEHFSKDQIINTRLGFRIQLNQIIKEHDNDPESLLFMVGTRGNMLWENLYEDNRKLLIRKNLDRVFLLLDNDMLHLHFEKHGLGNRIKYLPLFLNDYCAIFTMKVVENKIDVGKVIYFPISNLSKNINPILLEKEDFLTNAEKNKRERQRFPRIFFEYWLKSYSLKPKEQKEDIHLPTQFISQKHIEKEYEGWIKELPNSFHWSMVNGKLDKG